MSLTFNACLHLFPRVHPPCVFTTARAARCAPSLSAAGGLHVAQPQKCGRFAPLTRRKKNRSAQRRGLKGQGKGAAWGGGSEEGSSRTALLGKFSITGDACGKVASKDAESEGAGVHSVLLRGRSLLLVPALGQENFVHVRLHSAGWDCDISQVLGELLVAPDCELNVPRKDTHALVIPSAVTRELDRLSDKIFQDGGKVHRGHSAHALGEASFLQQRRHATHGEDEPSARALRLAADGFLAFLSALSFR